MALQFPMKMGTICQHCGGKGFDNAFIFCVTCLNFAVHRYCLPKLPKTFDEFVRWYCEDCEPKSANHCPPKKPRSSPSTRRDLLITKGGVRRKKSRKKVKKKDVACSVSQPKDQGQQSTPSQQPCDAKTKFDCTMHAQEISPSQDESDALTKVQLTEHAQLASDHSDQNIELKGKENTVSCLVAESEEQTRQSSPSQRPCEAQTELKLSVTTEHAQLASDRSDQNLELKGKEYTVSHLVAETEEQICQSSPSQRPCEAQTELELCVTNYSSLNENTTIWHSVSKTEEQLQSSPSQQPYKAQSELALCVASYSPLNENRTMWPFVTETLEQICQRCPSQQPCEVETELPLCVVGPTSLNDTIRPCSENYGNGLKLGKRRELTTEGGSEFGNEAEVVRIDDSQTTTGHLSPTLEQNYHLHAQPVSDRIWRGSFSICKKICGIFDGVVAHLSSKACQKVCEEAAMLPAVLYLEMLPKSDLWPESFQKSEPSDDHIGLYFFAESKWYEWVFDCLVDDMIEQELAMRASVKNAELLVFPSAELPIHYWKLQGKYYLWGVFRKKQDSSLHLSDQGLLVEKNNTELVVYSNSANGVSTGEEKNLSRTRDQDARSPLSPLSNSCSSGSGPY